MTTIQFELRSRKYPGILVTIDEADFELVSRYKWSPHGAKRGTPYAHSHDSISGKRIFLHTLLMNTPKGMVVDHIDGNPLNNSRANLRLCTQAENSRNTRKSKNNRTGIKGVCIDPQSGTYMVRCGRETIGRFRSLRDATSAYNIAASRKFGEFAKLNEYEKEDSFLKPDFSVRADNKTGFRGVCPSKQTGKYRAYFTHKGKTTWLGNNFNSPEEAALAYNTYAKGVLGDYAYQNKIYA